MALAKPKILTISNAAAERFKEIVANADKKIAGLRVGVKNSGCVGMAYTLEYADEIGPRDERIEDKGVTLLIDPKAIMFMLGTEIDFETTKLSSQFTFHNPNQTAACGCGESVAIEPVKLSAELSA